jgi:hypothetical protein
MSDKRQATNRSPKTVLCVFCNQRRPRSREDVIPNWLARELDPEGQITTDFITAVPGEPVSQRSQQFGSLATIKLRRACAGCNNTWMSHLQNLTRPLLEPLIRGFRTDLSPAAQRQIAAWCQLKALSLDTYYLDTHQGVQHLPSHVFHEFALQDQPLEHSTVTLGRHLPPEKGVVLPWGRYMVSTPAVDKRPALDVVVTTFGFGHLAIQVTVGARIRTN